MSLKHIKKSSGQTLLEALIALGALVVILTAVSVSVLVSLNNSSFIKAQNQANKLTQQGIEYIREQISSNDQFAIYSALTGTKCFNDVEAVPVISTTNCNNTANIGVFIREVTFTSGDCNIGGGSEFADGINSKVVVYWTSGKCSSSNIFCHKQEVESCFINPSKAIPTGAQGI